MKGYFAIYECSQNQWLMDGIGWRYDRDYYTQMVGTKHAIQTSQSYGYNPNLPQIEVVDTQSISVITDGGNKIDPNQIMKFETMMEAEEYLIATFSSHSGQFYSIRKIYF